MRPKTRPISKKVPLSTVIHNKSRTETATNEEMIYKFGLNKKEEMGWFSEEIIHTKQAIAMPANVMK